MIDNLDQFYTKAIEKDADGKALANQQELDAIKQERLDAFEAKVKQLAIWEDIEARKSSYRSKYINGSLLTSPVSFGGYLVYKYGKWLYERMAYGDKKEEEIPLSPFPIDNPVVSHFHPVAFVEQMKRMGNIWHDPIINPQRNKYNSSGTLKPVSSGFGHVRNTNGRTYNKFHSGLDIFALPGTEVYACMDGEVVFPKELNKSLSDWGSAGMIVKIKLDSTEDFIQRLKAVNYQLEFDKGEEMGCQIKSTDSIYIIHMHLSEYNVKKGDKVQMGDIIGKSGVSGSIASGIRSPHLHFEISTKERPYGTGASKRLNPARVIELNSYNTKEQDDSKNYRYNQDGTKDKC